MHVVGHAANAVQLTAHVVDQSHHIGIEVALVLLGEGALATVGADDNMVHVGGVAHVWSNGEWVSLLCRMWCVSDTHGS